MDLVSIDVDEARDVVRLLRAFVEDVSDQWTVVSRSASQALCSVGPLWGLADPLSLIAQSARDLESRIEYAIACNTTGSGFVADGKILEYPIPAGGDGVAALWEQRRAEAAVRAGREAAAALRDGEGEPDAGLVALLTDPANQNDPAFASGFAGELTPEELADLMVRLSDQCPASSSHDGRVFSPEQYAQQYPWYGPLVEGMSITFGTATRATGDLALPADCAQGWVDEMTAESAAPDHANALGVLLSSGTFSTAFLETVGDGVYEYERAYQREHGDGSVWGPRSSEDTPEEPSFGTGDYSVVYGIHDSQGRLVRDPLAGVMTALGKDAAAAQDFFDGGDEVTVEIDGQHLVVSDRLRYLIQDRTWAVDPADGGSLGQALVAATTVIRDRSMAGQVSAGLASQAFALIGQKSGEGADGITPWNWFEGQDPGWQMSVGMRSSVAEMLASYGPDVLRVVSADADDLAAGWFTNDWTLYQPGLPYGAVLDQGLLLPLIQAIGADTTPVLGDDGQPTTSVEILLQGVIVANNMAITAGLKEALANNSEAAVNLLRGLSEPTAGNPISNGMGTLGWIVSQAYAGAGGEEGRQRKQVELGADIVSFGLSVPFIPKATPATWKWVFDQAKTEGIDAVRGSAPSSADGRFRLTDEDLKRTAVDNVMNLMAAEGYFEPSVYAQANAAVRARGEEGSFTPPPAGAFIPNSDPPRFDVESGLYKDWLAYHGPKEFLNVGVRVPYDLEWPHVDS